MLFRSEALVGLFPNELKNGQITNYVEPFIGGGALFFFMAQKYDLKNFFLSDVNNELVLAYQTIQRNVNGLIDLLAKMQQNYHALDSEKQKEFFYQTRADFNAKKSKMNFSIFDSAWVERTAEIIFLNKTCFNGLFRVNAKGGFNVPFGSYENPIICDAENLLAVSNLLQKATIQCGDFTTSRGYIDSKTFVYFDPPYRPISRTASFTSYSTVSFDDNMQRKLAEYYRSLHMTGAKLMLSNSDPKNDNPDDHFFEELYSGFRLERVGASRMINSKAARRGKINELVIMNY